jgi:hypothetical protein
VKRVAFWIGTAALVALLATASLLHGRTGSADWRDPRVVTASSGLTARYPRAWHGFATGVAGESLVVASFPLARDWPDRPRKRVPDGGIYVWVFMYGRLPPSSMFPPRPSHFALAERDHGFYECGFGLEGYALRFRERGLAVQAMVALGRGARPEDATAVLDRLTIRRGLAPSLARA